MDRGPFECRVTAVRQVGPSVRELTASRLDGRAFSFIPGQYVGASLDEPFNSYYSLCKPPSPTGELSLCVKPNADGGAGPEVADCRAGDALRVSAALGRLTLGDALPRHLVLIAAGTGVAPFRAMFDQLRAHALGRGGRVCLLLGARHREALLYDDDWRELARLDGFRYRPILSRAGDGWTGPVGRVQRRLAETVAVVDPDRARFFVCGMEEMVADVSRQLVAAGIGCEAIRTESGAPCAEETA